MEHVLAAGWSALNDIQHSLATLHVLHNKEGIDVDNIEQVSLQACHSQCVNFHTCTAFYAKFAF